MTGAGPGLASMTGFAAASGEAAGHQWEWTLRSVNGKGLDLRLRLPPGYDRLEAPARAVAARQLSRGSVTANLTLKRDAEAAAQLTINQPALDAVLRVAADIARDTGAAPATTDGILGVRGVLDVREADLDDDARGALDDSLADGFSRTLDALVTARRSEGKALEQMLGAHLDTIAELASSADDVPGRKPEAIAERLRQAMAQLLDATPQLDADRLHQEAVLIAAKADVREEIDRLLAHVDAARAMLSGGGAVGRDLNFLAQEFNREANTLCSKSGDVDLTRIGLKLKGVIDQFREQVQNLE